jgi:predicted flavoprotein YhiN
VGDRHVVVVGAGAAGLTAALRAAEAGARVTLLNAHPKVGLKILMSGGTRCNVTHREVSERDFNGGSSRFVRSVLRAFPVERTLEWMQSLGIELKLEDTGKYFPASDDAQTVLDALINAVERAGVDLQSGARVVRIERGAGGESARFRLGIQTVRDSAAFVPNVRALRERAWPLPTEEPDRFVDADAVVLASGGLSFPRTGSDGTGYALATALGHTIVPPTPALTPLTADDPLCAAAQGVTLDAELALSLNGKRAAVTSGSLLITHFGYSGPAALDLSRHWLRAEGAGDRAVRASILPGEHDESLHAYLVERGRAEPRTTVRRVLADRLPDRIAQVICTEADVVPTQHMSQVPRDARMRLVERLLRRPMPVNGTLGYEKAEVTAGGVTLSEVDPATLESRVAPGLYICGEALDAEGRLGGFNFQWSWSSGTVAGRAAAKSTAKQ